MTSESAQAAGDASAAEPETNVVQDGAAGSGASAARKPAVARPRAGLPVWRTGKPDAMLAAAVDVAREAIASIAGPGEVGPHLGARSEGERLVTHLFESRLSGYVGWQWFAVLTRNSRSKVITVSELGLLPSEDSILAPEWVPWAERVRPEDEAQASDENASEADDVEVVEEAADDETADEADDAVDAAEDK